MDSTHFAQSLDDVFVGDPRHGEPVDGRLADIAAKVTGYTTPAELAVLKAAVDQLPVGEAYLEVGTFKGRSVCGALLDGTDRTVVAIENFQEFGMAGAEARDELMSNLRDHTAGAPGFRLVEGDCFAVLQDRSSVGEPVGVYFYDGAHTWIAHYLALGVVEHLLADEAVVLVDDATWPVVRKATMSYLDRHRGWRVLRAFDAETDHDERWANGLLVLGYRRPAGSRPRTATDVRLLLLVQRWVLGPFFGVAWKVVPRSKVLVAIGKKFFGRSSHRVPEDS
jgi:hypothetical protein